MAAALPFAIGFLLPPLVVLCAYASEWAAWLPVIFSFFVIPLLDRASGDSDGIEGVSIQELDGRLAFRAITWAWVPVQLALLWWALGYVAAHDLPRHAWLGLAASVGVCTGTIGITYAHELVHRASRWERALGELLLTTVSYAHFAVEHVYGHHRFVATPHDPATARAGETFYRFLPRTVFGGFASAWRLESARVRKRFGSVWHPAHRLYRHVAVQGVMYAALWAWGGWPVVAFVAAQALVAVSQLEVINYIEHYGLTRREVSPGVFERVQPHHSWDSRARISNWLLINLARHADHHCAASRRYQALHAMSEAPRLPAGYATMFLLALVPPLWSRVMDPRLAEWRSVHGLPSEGQR